MRPNAVSAGAAMAERQMALGLALGHQNQGSDHASMTLTAFVGPLLIGVGPLAVLFAAVVARKSFLVLLSFVSAFFWFLTLYAASLLLRVFVPIPPTILASFFVITIAVGFQELGRVFLNRIHGNLLRVLQEHAPALSGSESPPVLTSVDKYALAATHGLAHAGVNAAVVNAAWIPYALGPGTLYAPQCALASVFVIGALSSLCMSAVLVCCSVLALAPAPSPVPPFLLHYIASLLTLVSLIPRVGCLVSLPLQGSWAAAATLWTLASWWRDTAPRQ